MRKRKISRLIGQTRGHATACPFSFRFHIDRSNNYLGGVLVNTAPAQKLRVSTDLDY